MKKWVIISVIVILVLLIWKACSSEGNAINKCLKSRKGCNITGSDSTNFGDKNYLNGMELIAKNANPNYPFSLRDKSELKKAKLYFDVSSGLKEGIEKFHPFIKALGGFMSESEIEFFKSSSQLLNGNISDNPIKVTKNLDAIITELKLVTTFNAGYSHLDGTISAIVNDPENMSVFFTDFLEDIKGTSGSIINGKVSSCKVCEEGFSWATSYFSKWFNSGGQIIVVTQKANVNSIPDGNVYALMFIPKGKKINDLLKSLEESGIQDNQIAIFNPLGLDFDFGILNELEKFDDRSITILNKGPGYVVIGSENKELTDAVKDFQSDFKKDIKLTLIDQTGYEGDWNLKISESKDFYNDILPFISNNKPAEANLLHKNQRIQTESPLDITVKNETLDFNLKTIDNRGKNDLIFKKFTIMLSGQAELETRKNNFESKVKTLRGMTTNYCLFYALNKSLNKGGDSVHDQIYGKVPFYTIYSIVNVVNNK